MMSIDVFDKIQAIYDEAASRYATLKLALGGSASGFEILYTPPVVNADLMIIGLNPGGGPKDDFVDEKSARLSWPTDNAYLRSPQFPLAEKLETTLGREFLLRSVGLNVLFLRSSNEVEYKKLKVDSDKLRTSLLKDFELFSLASTRKILVLLKPKSILFLGFSTQRRVTGGRDFKTEELKRENGAKGWLLSSGEFDSIPSFAMCHPTGTWPPPTYAELKLVGERVRTGLDHSG